MSARVKATLTMIIVAVLLAIVAGSVLADSINIRVTIPAASSLLLSSDSVNIMSNTSYSVGISEAGNDTEVIETKDNASRLSLDELAPGKSYVITLL